jgi:DNA-binding transcriptional ArsR family regulator
MIIRRDVFQAIADPTRREIIQRLAKEPKNLNAIVEDFDMSRQAIAKHIRILTECGLLMITQKDNTKLYGAQLDKLNEVTDWVTQSKKQWVSRFEKLDKHLKAIKNKHHGKK